jgi:hypothetical protein
VRNIAPWCWRKGRLCVRFSPGGPGGGEQFLIG